jgi:hypothetical protein
MKNLCRLLLIINCVIVVNAQTQFQFTFGGIGADYSWAIKQTTDSAYTVAGYTNSFGAGGNDFYVLKFVPSSGMLAWSKTYGGPGNDMLLSMKLTTDGGYVMSGETDTYGAGAYDAFIMKLDNIGQLLWSKTIGGVNDDFGECIILTSDGGYAVGGYTNTFGAGDNDMIIFKFDPNGVLQWARTIGGTGYDYALSITQTSDHGYALLGSSSSSGQGFLDYYVAKIDSNGTLQWTKTIGGAGGDYGSSIVQSSDGGYALAGVTLSFGAGMYDIYVVKLDANGNLLWTRTVGGTDFEYVYSIINTNDGGFALAGSTASFGAGGYDAYVLKLDGSGNLQWNRTIGGTGEDNARSIIQTGDGGYAVTGVTKSFGEGDYDVFVIKFDAAGNTCGNTSTPIPTLGTGGILGSPSSITTSPSPVVSSPTLTAGTGGTPGSLCLVGIQQNSNEVPLSFSLSQNYPNPFNPITTIKFDIPPSKGDRGMTSVKLIIYDALGRKVTELVNSELNPGNYFVDWDGSGYTSAVYFYELQAGDLTETKKMVLIK